MCSGRTNLVETVRVEYDPSIVSYSELLQIFSTVNTAVRGSSRQYEGVIFVQSKEEAQVAKKFLDSNKQVVASSSKLKSIIKTIGLNFAFGFLFLCRVC